MLEFTSKHTSPPSCNCFASQFLDLVVIKDACDLKGLTASLHSGHCLQGPDVPHSPGDRGGRPACCRGTVLWPEPQSSCGAGERRWRGTEWHSLGRLCQPLRAGWAEVCRALSQAVAFYQMAWAAQSRTSVHPGLQWWGRAASWLADHAVGCKRTPGPWFGGIIPAYAQLTAKHHHW